MGPQINNQNQIQEMPNILNASQGNKNIKHLSMICYFLNFNYFLFFFLNIFERII